MPLRSSPPSPGMSRSARAWCKSVSVSAGRCGGRIAKLGVVKRAGREPPRCPRQCCRRGRNVSGRSGHRAFGRAALADHARCSAADVLTSVHGIGSRSIVRPSGAPRSHSAANRSVSRASSGSLPATSACLRAKARAGLQRGAVVVDAGVGLDRGISRCRVLRCRCRRAGARPRAPAVCRQRSASSSVRRWRGSGPT